MIFSRRFMLKLMSSLTLFGKTDIKSPESLPTPTILPSKEEMRFKWWCNNVLHPFLDYYGNYKYEFGKTWNEMFLGDFSSQKVVEVTRVYLYEALMPPLDVRNREIVKNFYRNAFTPEELGDHNKDWPGRFASPSIIIIDPILNMPKVYFLVGNYFFDCIRQEQALIYDSLKHDNTERVILYSNGDADLRHLELKLKTPYTYRAF